MTHFRRQALFERLNPFCYEALQLATAFCKMRGHAYIELVHWLYQMLDRPDSDMVRQLQAAGIDFEILMRDFSRSLDRLPQGATAISDFAFHIDEAVKEGWIVANLGFGSDRIRSGHLLIACLSNPSLNNAVLATSAEFSKLKVEAASAEFAQIVDGSPEAPAPGNLPSASGQVTREGGALAQFAIDLTEMARSGKLDPVIGRDAEIRMMIDVLMRRRQNNPLLTGDAGVGKTAVVEGLACAIVNGDVPPTLRNARILALDIGLLQAGAGARGAFEERLRQVITEAQSPDHNIILFIDEAHSLVGAGGQEGTGDAANLLKPALARGTLKTIGATTWSEYKRHIEKDPALTRRFQPIAVEEPAPEQAIAMMRGIAATLERHHGIEITDDAVIAAVRLSHRYIPARQLPDKAISLLDTCCSRVSAARHSPPPELGLLRQTIANSQLELGILERMAADGDDVAQRHVGMEKQLGELLQAEGLITKRWQTELSLVLDIGDARAAARSGDKEGLERKSAREKLSALQRQFAETAGEQALVEERVTPDIVARIVQEWTGVPVGRLLKSEASTLLSLAETLGRRVIGQDQAVEAIVKRIQTSRAGLDDPNKPIGVFLLCGPSGVGKTETAHALAELMQGGSSGLVTINMSEFQEAHTVSGLKGAPPGYVGYGQGGRLTEAVRRRPNSVVLLDEIEKAHPDVHELFYQVFDKGVMEDGEGRLIDFRNTLILMTSNIGSSEISDFVESAQRSPDIAELEALIRKPLAQVFAPALLGRMIVLPYRPLSDDILHDIVELQLSRIADRVFRAHEADFSYSDAAIRLIVERARQSESGGRVIQALLTNAVLPAISRHVFGQQLEGRTFDGVYLDAREGEFIFDFSSVKTEGEDANRTEDADLMPAVATLAAG
ncbi:type VI secretion system ATPase TssH [Pararhizobium arenae]|uniref:type VI secretion system ATPase TssH n=1 Tax=Pararhizobium arenae TaxID=1856850 RepID=UPI001FD95C64|nr:type VI secretion system ATPase TssH [Pararhizobium arenae]